MTLSLDGLCLLPSLCSLPFYPASVRKVGLGPLVLAFLLFRVLSCPSIALHILLSQSTNPLIK